MKGEASILIVPLSLTTIKGVSPLAIRRITTFRKHDLMPIIENNNNIISPTVYECVTNTVSDQSDQRLMAGPIRIRGQISPCRNKRFFFHFTLPDIPT